MADTPSLNYSTIYDQLNAKANQLRRKRNDLEVELGDVTKELESLDEALNKLAPLAGHPVLMNAAITDLGITDAVRAVLDPETKMSAGEVKAKMEKQGFDFSKYSAPDASVRTVLSRLVEAGKAGSEKEGYKIFYKWIPTEDDIDIPF